MRGVRSVPHGRTKLSCTLGSALDCVRPLRCRHDRGRPRSGVKTQRCSTARNGAEGDRGLS